MNEDINICMMGKDFILWRCQHGGPLDAQTIMQWDEDGPLPWKELYDRNMPLLTKLTETYGACAVLARDGKKIAGHLRFYPKKIIELNGKHQPNFCLQQKYPEGPAEELSEKAFLPLEALEDKTLFVHCIMVGYSLKKENPYLRKGIGNRMVKFLVEWAGENGWEAIETKTYEDIPYLYAISGSAGKSFWEKLGFSVTKTETEEILKEDNEFSKKARASAAAAGIDLSSVSNAYIMRLDL